jgi:hypothetical protein
MVENYTVKPVHKKLLTSTGANQTLLGNFDLRQCLTIFLSAIFLVGCATTNDPYSLSNIDEIRELEKRDHKLCASFKLNFDLKDNFLNRDYWHCRISFAKYRLSTGRNITAKQAKYDEGIRDLVTKISLKISVKIFLCQGSKIIFKKCH